MPSILRQSKSCPGNWNPDRAGSSEYRQCIASCRCQHCEHRPLVVYLQSMADFTVMSNAYGRFFGADPPARTTVAVSGLPRGALIEIEVTAVGTLKE